MKDVFLEPVSNYTKKKRFERVTVNQETFHYDVESNFLETEHVHFTSANLVDYNVSEGDYVFFYTGDSTYRYVGRVKRTEHLPRLSNELEQNSKLCETAFVFESIQEISLDAEELSSIANWNVNYLVGFTRLQEEFINRITEKYSSIENFINANK